MKQIDLKEMQQIELNLLRQFDRLCKENDLRYYIDGGTLLGAMCYEGFIPWDDDIDLKMPRPDYERLASLKNRFPGYISLIVPSKENCCHTMTKLIDNRTVLIEKKNEVEKIDGVYIDILPMDGYPENNDNHFRKLQKYNSLFHSSLIGFRSHKESSSVFARIKGFLYQYIYSPWKLYCILTRIAKQYEYDNSDYVGLLIEGEYAKEMFQRRQLDDNTHLQFEDMMVPAPNDYEKHLQRFYGNHINKKDYYHNLPYIASNHEYEVYWKE